MFMIMLFISEIYDYIIFNYYLIYWSNTLYLKQLFCHYIPSTHILVLGHLWTI